MGVQMGVHINIQYGCYMGMNMGVHINILHGCYFGGIYGCFVYSPYSNPNSSCQWHCNNVKTVRICNNIYAQMKKKHPNYE